MHLTRLLLAGVVPVIASARALSRRAVDCSFTTNPSTGDTYDLKALNPVYCVSGTVTGKPEPTTTTTTTTSKTTTRPTTSTTTTTTTNVPEPTNEPAIPGIVDNCDGFYKVSSGDQCGTIAADHGISTAQFLEWNTEVNEQCSNLWLDYYVCVHVPSATTGPQPQMAGIISTCTDLLQGPGRRQLLHDPELGGNRPFQLPAVEYGD